MSELSERDLEKVADVLAAKLLGHRRAIKVDEQRVNVKPRRPAGYTYVYLEHLVGIELTGKEWSLLFLLASRADHNGVIVYSAGEVALQMGMENSQFHKALRHIVDAGVMEKMARKALRLNPRILWHGSSAAQVKLLAEQIGAEIRLTLHEGGLLPLSPEEPPTPTSAEAVRRPRARARTHPRTEGADEHRPTG